MEFQLRKRRYGPTVHLTPIGELDLKTKGALDEVQTGLDGVAVVVCDMRHLTFMDVTGLNGLTASVHRLNARGVAFSPTTGSPSHAASWTSSTAFTHPPAGTETATDPPSCYATPCGKPLPPPASPERPGPYRTRRARPGHRPVTEDFALSSVVTVHDPCGIPVR
ncbi:STAS domain-containing protein [Streptomyces goshikiensis]|uniref:STAS domain-containing protein n=1 Tax=Streptomyces goshikiensis TaxID=1942 RepID=UPI003720B439